MSTFLFKILKLAPVLKIDYIRAAVQALFWGPCNLLGPRRPRALETAQNDDLVPPRS